VRQAISLDRATAIIGHGTSIRPALAVRAGSLLNEAGALNPDRQVDLERINLELELHHVQAARELAREVTRAEPENVEAWVSLAETAGDDPALFAQAVHKIRALEPLLPFR